MRLNVELEQLKNASEEKNREISEFGQDKDRLEERIKRYLLDHHHLNLWRPFFYVGHLSDFSIEPNEGSMIVSFNS